MPAHVTIVHLSGLLCADPFAALEGLSHPTDTALAPSAGGIDLDALYGGVTDPQAKPTPTPGDSFGAMPVQPGLQPQADPFADPFAPPPYQTTTNLMGAHQIEVLYHFLVWFCCLEGFLYISAAAFHCGLRSICTETKG